MRDLAPMLLFAMLSGCTPSGAVDVDIGPYARACEFDDDCVVVPATKCETCSCTATAIAATDEAQFDADYEDIACTDPNENAVCGPCPQILPACITGTCGTRTAIYPMDLDAVCATDADCTTIESGEICDCSCEFVPVNQPVAAAYRASTAGIECHSRDQCRCEPPDVVCGSDGQCVFTPE